MLTGHLLILPAPSTAMGQGSTIPVAGSGTAVPGGIESIFEFNGLYLNLRQWEDTFLVTQIDGLGDADIRDTRDVNPADHGETPFSSLYGGRTITLSGKIRAASLSKMRDMIHAMRAAFGDISKEFPLVIRSGNINTDVQVYCKKIQPLSIPEVQSDFTYRRDFQVALRASNPRFLSVLESYNLLQINASPSSIAVINRGNTPARPRIQIVGPITNPVITNTSNGLSMSFTGTVPSGQVWEIDAWNKTIADQTGVSKFSVYDVTSSWIELQPGSNTLQVTGTGITAGTTQLVVYVRDTWI